MLSSDSPSRGDKGKPSERARGTPTQRAGEPLGLPGAAGPGQGPELRGRRRGPATAPSSQLPGRAQLSWGSGALGQVPAQPGRAALTPCCPETPRSDMKRPQRWPLTEVFPGLGCPRTEERERRQRRPCGFPGAAQQMGTRYTHGGTALGAPEDKAGRHNRGPRALWIPGAPGDGV